MDTSDQRVTIPEEAPAEVLAFNDEIAKTLSELPAIWDVGAPLARKAREEGKGVFGEMVRSDRAETITIEGPGGNQDLRIIRPENPRGVYLHLHGGGWVLGANHHADIRNEWLADATGLTVVAAQYRLAPEFPYPAAPDDCEHAALWLVDNAMAEFGTDVLAIGGESAGAHLSLVTMLRARDRLGDCPFSAAALIYGMYDLGRLPSVRAFGDQPLILNDPVTTWFVDQFVGDRDLTDPDISPLFADLSNLPPALFSIGTMDPLLDDSLHGYQRYVAAGNEARLDVWPGAIHAFDYFDNDYGRMCRTSIHQFLNEHLDRAGA
ncbi:MAG: alpha/beta hydrolase [Acidimicrobiia bacterium]|nr:alpha/beta hydrolase [Acidimicrobiia bacterium]NNL46812.1 alpha/beta hydrolase [Acidimicrobiia bacterium]